jgi:methylated-DNA-[protein]-cysteine S-methyltransferase
MNLIQYKMISPAGPVYLVGSPQGLEGIFWQKQGVPLVKALDPSRPEHKMIFKAMSQLEEYFDGKRTSFDLDLYFKGGTPFQRKVWKALADIPFGQTVSYKDIAQRINHPKAVRAVGTANGQNPFCIVVPCHRVINANGGIGGYGGGIAIKKKLLNLETTVV